MNNKKLLVRRAILVYQAGIANVFVVDCLNLSPYGRNAQRLIQADFRTCEAFARGLAVAGALVSSAYCNQAGDIINVKWCAELNEAPFSNEFHPVVARDGELLA